jgi:hypothetical protein
MPQLEQLPEGKNHLSVSKEGAIIAAALPNKHSFFLIAQLIMSVKQL